MFFNKNFTVSGKVGIEKLKPKAGGEEEANFVQIT